MKLYNTLTRQIEKVTPLSSPLIGIYTCGPTVYDYAHVGHWFTYIRTDLLIRALKANELRPKWIMNITDVGHLVSDADDGEDKLEKGAKREGKTAWEIAEHYTADFIECMQILNITKPDEMPKATDHINEQIDLIKQLEQRGFTYQIDDGIYYDTAKFPKYADFARLDLDEQQAGARVNYNPQKRNTSDFALWKLSPAERKRDMEWDSPWGKGFPGWHIECSAMSMKYLGPTLDIHTGGIDHIPVHHANEIAQSEVVTGKPFSKHWLHTNHVLVDGQKISKSLNNGRRIQQIIGDGITPEAFRLHVLESHYRSQSKFSMDSLEAAQNRLNDLRAFAALRWQPQEIPADSRYDISTIPAQIIAHLSDDLNTPMIVALLSDVSSGLQSTLLAKDQVDELLSLLQSIDSQLGLNLTSVKDISDEQKSMIASREDARNNQDWQLSDEIRKQLSEKGIGLRDTPLGPIWFPL